MQYDVQENILMINSQGHTSRLYHFYVQNKIIKNELNIWKYRYRYMVQEKNLILLMILLQIKGENIIRILRAMIISHCTRRANAP